MNLHTLPLAVICALICACGDYDDAQSPPAPLRYDLEGLPSCSWISAQTSYQGSCDDGQACAWAPELGAGVCAQGCREREAGCPSRTVCRHTDDGAGWVRTWCAPVTRQPARTVSPATQ